MTQDALRAEICRVGASLHARGYVHASAGNISVRTDGGYLITPTDACLGTLDPAHLAEVNTHGEQTGGERASKTLALHRSIYAAEPGARCIIHTHATHLVALTLAGGWSVDDIVPPITPYYVMKVGHVPLIPYHRPGDPAVAAAVAHRIAGAHKRHAPIRAVMLDRLGPVVWHRTPAEASAVLEELEETARLWLMTKAAPLTPDQIDELRTHFGAHW
ncbi:MAG TPA: aldolase [Burkholderiaceae bacterium]|nr:aldolase [Burkholderiaceae bacterium]